MDELLYVYARSVFKNLKEKLKGKLYFHVGDDNVIYEVTNAYDFKFTWYLTHDELYHLILHGKSSQQLANEMIEHYEKTFFRFVKSKLFY